MRLRRNKMVGLVSLLLLVSVFAGYQNVYANGVSPLVETQWVEDNQANLKLVYVGFEGADDKKKYEGKHISGSAYMGMNELMTATMANNNTPDKAKYEELMGQLGISNDSSVVLYSTPAANPFIPQAYWLMRYFGHDKVSIMNGSLDKWVSEGRKTDGVPGTFKVTSYKAVKNNPNILAEAAYVFSNLKNDKIAVIDSRGPDEYSGETKREYIKAAGHIPGAVNLNFYPTNRIGSGAYKSPAELKAAYEAAGVTKDKEIIAYCEGGPRAADAYFALKELLGYPNVKVYVGSWMEWGNDEKYPLEK